MASFPTNCEKTPWKTHLFSPGYSSSPGKSTIFFTSMDWFKGKSLTGKPHDLHGKIGLVSGFDFPKKTNPLTSVKYARPNLISHLRCLYVSLTDQKPVGPLGTEPHNWRFAIGFKI